jgi:hypothetical protein
MVASVDALKATSKTGNFDILVFLDDDDTSNYPPMEHVRYYRGPRKGYPRLHECIAEHLIPHAKGRWFWLWNDDATMETPSWDVILQGVDPHIVLNPDSNFSHQSGVNTFPIVPKAWVDLVGWAKNGANDTWWQVVGQLINRHVPIHIKVKHKPTDSRTQGYDPSTFFSMENYARMGFTAGRIHQAFYANLKRKA